VDITASPPSVLYDSLLLTHGRPTPRAYLLFHGLTASPRQFEAFGRALFERGSNVSIPRLPRHGHDRLTTELRHLTADELRAFASDALTRAAELGDEVVVVGFSAGGLLSAWLAQHRAVARSVSIAPLLGIAWLPRPLTGFAARTALRAPNRFLWWDPILRERLGPPHGYPRFATHAVAHAAILARELLADAKHTAPSARDIRIVLNAHETTVNNAAARRLAALWSRPTASVVVRHLQGLPLSHDIIEPLRRGSLAAHVYPTLLDIVAS